MCGITGIFAFNLVGKFNKIQVTNATMALQKRGPDFQDTYIDEWVGLGHRRLSILDTSSHANQPMWDETGRYCIVFNGEIFNFHELKQHLESRGTTFFSTGDTEVLLKMFILEKETCLNKLNGFFSFCVYDKVDQTFFLARDRYGIKPLLFLFDDDKFLFASEMKSVMQYGIEKSLDYSSLYTYLQLNYIPAPDTILSNVKKLLPGHYLTVSRQKLDIQQYYHIPYDRDSAEQNNIPYAQAKEKVKQLLEASVQRRLVSDVPLGAFLSGVLILRLLLVLPVDINQIFTHFPSASRMRIFDETHYPNL